MQYLVGTASIHTTAAICDYLERRATGDDTVTVVGVAPTDDSTARRDVQEALNVAPVRLATVGDVQTQLREDDGEPAAVLREAIADHGADELLLAPRSGLSEGEGPSGLGETARTILEDAPIPVVVVPTPEA